MTFKKNIMPFYELFCGVTSGVMVSPIMTVLDSAIIKSQLNKLDFKKSLIETANDYLTKKTSFKRPLSLMLLVYSSTYSTANLTESYCKANDIDYKLPTLFATSVVNIMAI